MQSIPRGQLSTCRDQERVSNPKTVSVIPKISQANNLLHSILQLSKPVSHLFSEGFNDVQTQSSSKHKLYQPSNFFNDQKQKQNLCIFLLKGNTQEGSLQKRKIKNQFKYENLKHFFLSQNQNLIFISRSVCSILNEEQNSIFKQLILEKYTNLDEFDQKKIAQYKGTITKLVNILLQYERFPFLCPQLNQTISLKSSFQNVIQQQSEDSLIFNDNFQSSNILMVKQLKTSSYIKPIYCICTRFDYQTASYGQWFYFSVKRAINSRTKQKQQKISQDSKNKDKFKFVICNMTKQYSLFGVSMKISVCRNGIWGKEGQNIQYYQTYFYRSEKANNENILFTGRQNHQFYYALQFELELLQGEQILVSYNEPYTYSRLSNLLDNFHKVYHDMQISSKRKTQFYDATTVNSQGETTNLILEQHIISEINSVYYKKQIVSQTPLQNQISCLTFSMRKSIKKSIFKQQQLLHNQNQNSDKKIIFILARVHPIETAGSFVVEGIIKNLFLFTEYTNNKKRKAQLKAYFQSQGKDKLLQNLLKTFIIKIIPMINPDGVIIGNSRCNFHGFDLNRQWKRSNKSNSQQISSLKRYLLKFKDKIQMVIDLHGHSKERNVFAYGMHDFRDPYVTREFPFILSKLVTNNFSFNQCKFTRITKIPKTKQSSQKGPHQANSKEGTARIWLFRKLSIPNIFTIQNSYCSSSNSPFHYDSFSYADIGKQILHGISMYYINFSSSKSKVHKNQQNIKNKQFLEDQMSKQLQKDSFGFDDLVKFKDSLIFDLKRNQNNASVGLDDINSSQSEQEIRNFNEFNPIRIKEKSIEKEKLQSPNKTKSQHTLKKVIESSQKLSKIKLVVSRHRNSSNESQENEPILNFKQKFHTRLETNEQTGPNLKREKLKLISNRRYSRNQLCSETKNKINQIRYQKRSVSNYKSTSELQKNALLSVVEVGWDQSKLIEEKVCETERVLCGKNDLVNFPQIKSDANAIFIHRTNISMKYKQVSKNFTATDKILPNNTQELHQKTQLNKNINQFIKKIQSNRKLQNQMIMTRKMQKYKQIIMKIHSNNN